MANVNIPLTAKQVEAITSLARKHGGDNAALLTAALLREARPDERALYEVGVRFAEQQENGAIDVYFRPVEWLK